MSDTPRTDAETCRDEMDHVDTDFGPFAPSDTVPADFARQLEREVQQCKEIVWQAALSQSGRCGITERLLLKLYNDMERASPAPDTKTP
jgi:hypothetical protein